MKQPRPTKTSEFSEPPLAEDRITWPITCPVCGNASGQAIVVTTVTQSNDGGAFVEHHMVLGCCKKYRGCVADLGDMTIREIAEVSDVPGASSGPPFWVSRN